MKMNRWLGCLAALAMTFSINVEALQAEKRALSAEDRLAHRIERMKEELMLNDSEAKKFATVYKNYATDLKACFPNKEKTQATKEEVKKPLSDQELDKLMTDRLDNQIKIAQIRKKYYTEFKKFLNVKQLEKLYSSENKGFEKHRKTPTRMGKKGKKQPCCGEKTVCDDGRQHKRGDRPRNN